MHNTITEHQWQAIACDAPKILQSYDDNSKIFDSLSHGQLSMITEEALNSTHDSQQSVLYLLVQRHIKTLLKCKDLQNKITREGLNRVDANGISPLMLILAAPEGKELLANSQIIGKISQNGLNHIVTGEKRKGQSALLLLCHSHYSSILYENPSLVDLIDPDVFNKPADLGDTHPFSPLMQLVVNVAMDCSDMTNFTDDTKLHTFISAIGLTSPAVGLNAGLTVFSLICQAGLFCVFKNNPNLIEAIEPDLLNSICTRVMIDTFSVFENNTSPNEALTIRPNQSSTELNHITHHRKTTHLYFMLLKNEGLKLLKDFPSLTEKISLKGLNTLIDTGESAGMSALILLCKNPEIISKNKRLMELFDPKTFNSPVCLNDNEPPINALVALCLNEGGTEMITTHVALFKLISTEGLAIFLECNFLKQGSIAAKSAHEMQEALIALLQTDKVRHIIETNENIRKKAQSMLLTNQQHMNTIAQHRDARWFLTAYTKIRPKLTQECAFNTPEEITLLNNKLQVIERCPITQDIIYIPARIKGASTTNYYEYHELYWYLFSKQSDPMTPNKVIAIPDGNPDNIIDVCFETMILMMNKLNALLKDKNFLMENDTVAVRDYREAIAQRKKQYDRMITAGNNIVEAYSKIQNRVTVIDLPSMTESHLSTLSLFNPQRKITSLHVMYAVGKCYYELWSGSKETALPRAVSQMFDMDEKQTGMRGDKNIGIADFIQLSAMLDLKIKENFKNGKVTYRINNLFDNKKYRGKTIVLKKYNAAKGKWVIALDGKEFTIGSRFLQPAFASVNPGCR